MTYLSFVLINVNIFLFDSFLLANLKLQIMINKSLFNSFLILKRLLPSPMTIVVMFILLKSHWFTVFELFQTLFDLILVGILNRIWFLFHFYFMLSSFMKFESGPQGK